MTHCDIIPRDQVSAELLERFDEPDEVFYQVKNLPSFCIAREPARIIPSRVIPADPDRDLPERVIPEKRIPALNESINAMYGKKVFAGSQL